MLENFVWHSSIGIDLGIDREKVYDRLPKTASVLSAFSKQKDSKMLIHKASNALWKLSEDGKTVEACTASDVLTEDQIKELLK